MVRYYGRARQRIGSVNTNQLGLKMSGCPSKIGKQGALVKYQSRRVQCNQKFCGPVYYQGQMWSWNQDNCLPAAPKNQSLAGGVGNINTPRFNCNSKCVSNGNIIKQLEDAYIILENYFNNNFPDYVLVLFGDRESLKSDEILNVHLNDIIHLNDYSNYPKDVLNAITLFNSVKYKGVVNNVYMVHKIALIKTNLYVDLFPSYGKTLQLNSKKIIAMENNSNKKVLTLPGITFKVPTTNRNCNSIYYIIKMFWGNLSKICPLNNEPHEIINPKNLIDAIGYFKDNHNIHYIELGFSKEGKDNYNKSLTLTIKKEGETNPFLKISAEDDQFILKNQDEINSLNTNDKYDITVTIEE